VPIEETAHWQYKTGLIIFPLNLQTITIILDAVKWREERDYDDKDDEENHNDHSFIQS